VLGSEVWATEEEVSLIHPMGHEKGWADVKANFYEKGLEKMFTKRELTLKDITLHALGDSAWVELNFEFNGTLPADKQQITTKGRETQVLKRTPKGWRIVHVHYSLPLVSPGQ
jgi:ketosteroid isomerase-like protein